MGQGPELLDGVLDVCPQLVHHLDGRGRVVLHGVLGQAELDGQRHQVLLGPVVQVPLQLAALGVTGGDDAGAAGPWLLVGAQLRQDACSAESSCMLWRARPTWRASSPRTGRPPR